MNKMLKNKQIDVAFKGSIGDFRLDIEFQMPLNGITALFGPSGCGKTTILRCLAGLHQMPGKVIVENEIWQNDQIFIKTHKRSVGYIFQEANLFSHLTVQQNLLYGAKRARLHNLKETFHYNDVIELLGINHLLNRSTLSLSGGERQRVAIGRAILAQPRLLLMDEPLSALDQNSKEGILACFQRLHNEFSLPILYVSHDIKEVSLLSDRIIALEEGKKIKEGITKEILPSLSNNRLSKSIGEAINKIDIIASVKEHDSNHHMTILDFQGQEIILPWINEKQGKEVTLSFLTDSISIIHGHPEIRSSANMLIAYVENIELDPKSKISEISLNLGTKFIKLKTTQRQLNVLSLKKNTQVFLLIANIFHNK
ncbi:MAG: molybdenum ABC transporter ATP-binding protein [Kordiimonadaceae bacterium]|nr:molybdenum ABC transporter ATP-binding protein [Kordiimonadaceae bacterium]